MPVVFINEILIIWLWNCIYFSFSFVLQKWNWNGGIVQFLNPIPIGDISEGALGVFGTAVCQFIFTADGRRWRSYSNSLIKWF